MIHEEKILLDEVKRSWLLRLLVFGAILLCFMFLTNCAVFKPKVVEEYCILDEPVSRCFLNDPADGSPLPRENVKAEDMPFRFRGWRVQPLSE